MDLNSLPNEMLVSVLKYSNSASLVKLRKMNCHLNETAKRAAFCRLLPVEFCRITFGRHSTPELIKICMDETMAKNYNLRQFIFEIRDIQGIRGGRMEQLISHLKMSTCVIQGFSFDNHYDCLKRHEKSLSKTKELHLKGSTLDNSKEKQKLFLQLFAECRKLRLHEGVEPSLLCTEILGTRRWHSLEVIPTYTTSNPPNTIVYEGVDDKFLINVISLCHNASIPLEEITNITLNGFLESVLILSQRQYFKCNWILGTILTNSFKIEKFFLRVAEIENVILTKPFGSADNGLRHSLFNSIVDIRINGTCHIQVTWEPNNLIQP